MDFLNVFFLVEEYTDVENAEGVRRIVEVCTDALRNPGKPRPDGEVILGELMRQYVRDSAEVPTYPTVTLVRTENVSGSGTGDGGPFLTKPGSPS